MRKLNEKGEEEEEGISYGGQLFNEIVRRAQTGQTDLLRELGKVRIGEQWHVAQQLVAHIGLGRVLGHRRVSDVLRRVEDAEGEAGQKVARRQQTGHWSQREAGALAQKVGHVFQLRNVVLPVAAVLDEQLKYVVELFARVRRIEPC